MLVFCGHGSNFAKPLYEVDSFVVVKALLFKVRPIELRFRFSVDGNEHPFKDLIGYRLSVLNLNFGHFFNIQSVCHADPRLTDCNVFFFKIPDLLLELLFLIVHFHILFVLRYLLGQNPFLILELNYQTFTFLIVSLHRFLFFPMCSSISVIFFENEFSFSTFIAYGIPRWLLFQTSRSQSGF